MSSRKISPRRRSDYKRPRRSIPPVNQQKRELKAALEQERQLVETLMRDAQVRRSFDRGMGNLREPMSVWADSDHSWAFTELGPKHLPTWEKLTEAMKMFIGFDAAMEFGSCYTFTAHIDPGLIGSWTATTHGFMANVEQRLRRALARQGLRDLPYCYLVETRSRSGRSSTRPHLHGFCVAEHATTATRFKVALEGALHPDLARQGRRRAIQIKAGADWKEEFVGRGRWVSYMTKNIDRWDARLGKRRVFMSRTFVEIARLAWSVRRED